MNSCEFEITIQSYAGNDSWPAVVRYKQSDGLTIHAKSSLILSPEDFCKLREESENEKKYGILLGKALFRDQVREIFIRAVSKSSQDDSLRILLTLEAGDRDRIESLHWERLCAPIDADGSWNLLARDRRIPFSLYIPTPIDRRFPPMGRRDLRALVLVASPSNIGRYQLASFDVEAAVKGVKEALGEIPCEVLANQIKGALGPPTLQELSKQLTSAAKPYTLLHIIGHGKLIDTGETVLFWATEDNEALPVTGTQLLEELRHAGNQKGLPHFAFLCTCETADPRAEGALGGLAQRLVRDLGMPAVVAMTRKVTVKTGLALGQSFYRRLRESGEVDVALQEATAGLGDRHDITVPALFSRLGGRPLFSDRLDRRELTDEEIKYGVNKLRQLLQERAPEATVLKQRFKTQVDLLKQTQGSDSRKSREEKKEALLELNHLCEQVIDLSFDALAALGKEPPPYKAECPFPGLSSFSDNKYHKFFFGRDELIKELDTLSSKDNFLAVIGPSGSGKSSVVLAGLIPRLKEWESGLQWTYMTPGQEPLKHLERRLEKLSKILPELALLVIDQFEELFTLCDSQTERQTFIEKLLEFSKHRKAIVTLRADFLGEVTYYPDLREKIETRQKLVGPMKPAELITAMKMQADSAGLRFEAGLSQSILQDVQGEPGAMPLLQYALQELWKRRRGRWLCSEEYEAIGGVKRAIAKTANDFYNSLPVPEQEQVRNIFLRLTRVDTSAGQGDLRRDTRRRVDIEELLPSDGDLAETKKLVQKLAGEGARLVITSQNETTGKQDVEVAHEALIRYWPLLQKWLHESQNELQLRETISQAAKDWQLYKDAPDRHAYLIHQGGRLEDAEILLKQPKFVQLNQQEAEYVTACVELREKRLREEKERTRRQLALASVTSVVFAGFALFAGYQWRQATLQEIQALRQSAEAFWLSGQELDAFIKSVTAEQSLQQPILRLFKPDNQLPNQIQETLNQIVGELKEYNRLEGHTDAVNRVVYSPNGQSIATASADGTVKLWDLTGKQWGELKGGDSQIYSLSFSPDGNAIATADAKGSVKLWNLSGQLLYEFKGHQGDVTSVSFSPDGKFLATGSYDKTAKLWDLTRKQQVQEFKGHTNRVTSVSFSPDGKSIATASVNGMVKLWDLKGKVIRELKGHRGEVNSLSFNPKRQLLVTASTDNTAKLWDLKTGKPLQEFKGHQAKLSQAVFSPDGNFIATSSADGTAKLWNFSGKLLLEFKGHQGPVFSLSFSPNGQQLATASGNHNVRLWDLTQVWNPSDWQLIDFKGHQGKVLCVRFSPTTPYIASAGDDRIIRLWDFKGKQIQEFKGHTDNVVSVSFSPKGEYLVSGSFDGTAKLWNIKTGQLIQDFKGHKGHVISISFSPDGPFLLTGGFDGTAKLWNLKGQVVQEFNHQAKVWSVAFDIKGQSLATSGADGIVKFWDLAGKKIQEFKAHSGDITGLKFSRDGHYLATSSLKENTAKIWNLNGKLISELKDHKSAVINLDFTWDSKEIATTSADGIARLWTVKGQFIREFKGHKGPVIGVSFSPDDLKLATASIDGTAKLWPIQGVQEVMVYGCNLVHDYLHNPTAKLTMQERHICDGIPFRSDNSNLSKS